MLITFKSFVTVVICARSEGGLLRWRDLFGRELGNFSADDGFGGWVGELVVETEPHVAVTKWGPTDQDIHNIARLGRMLQAAETQESVAVIFYHPLIGWQANLLFNEQDWAELEATLVKVTAVPV